MADGTESVDVKLPSGETITTIVPTGWSDQQIHANLLMKHPELFPAPESQQVAQRPSQTAPIPQPGQLAKTGLPLYQQHPANVLYRDIQQTQPQSIPGRQEMAQDVSRQIPIQGGMALGSALTGPAIDALAPAAGAGLLTRLGLTGARAAVSGVGLGAGALAGGATPQEAKTAAVTGAVTQPVAEGVSAAAGKIAPKLAESGLRISDLMRGRGRTIGDAVLEHTTGIDPAGLAVETKQAIGKLVGQMETNVNAATQQGLTGSAQPARQVLNDAIQNLPRNARTLATKMQGLNDLFDLGNGQQATYTPSELLEMKRGIGKEIKSWPPEWKNNDDIKNVEQRIYGAIDGEIDRLVPGNAELNQIISSLTPAKNQARRIALGASGLQKLARMAAHTGALTSSVVSGDVGYRKGGIPGAVAGATAGLLIPEALASPRGQIAAARLINSLGDKAISPGLLPIIKNVIATEAMPKKEAKE